MVDLKSIDVNLLVALDALLSERNVTEAGKKVGIAQSSMSHALGRLRELFGDPLLVRSAGRMIPTPLAERIEGPLRSALENLGKAIQVPMGFDPSVASATLRLATDAVQQVVLLPRVLDRLDRSARGVLLRTVPPASPESTYGLLRDGGLDFAIGRFEDAPAGVHRRTLSRDRVVYIARRGHPRIKGQLTKKRLAAERQVIPTPVTGGRLPRSLEPHLEDQRAEWCIATTPHLVASLFIVSHTDLISATIERAAELYKDALGLRVYTPPVPFPTIDTHLVWHERTDNSDAHRWFRTLLLECSK